MKAIDMTGIKINHLTFLERDLEKGQGYWKCQCDCGNIITVRKDQVTRKKYPKQDCGCGLKERLGSNLKNEIGNKYGKLTVLYRAKDLRSGEAKWHCKCDCGNECDVNGTNLRLGISTNCGCERSVGELKINNILKEHKINFKREYTFENLLGSSGGRLRFDFGILDSNNNLLYLIEYDGVQHYKENCFGKEKEDFDILKQHDNLKNQYCKDNNIILIRIPYTKLANLKFEDLVPKEVSLK